MKLTIVIPSYNEEKRLPSTLKKIDRYLQKRKKIRATILVVDDGSTDNTAGVVKKTKVKSTLRYIRLKKNSGKGAAVKKGILSAKTDWILFSDADLSTPIEELDTFAKHTNSHDIIIASRNLPKSKIKVKQPLLRSTLGKGFAYVVPALLGLKYKDTQCGFKLFRKECARTLVQNMLVQGWAFDAEMLFLAKKLGYHTKELPVSWFNSNQSKVDSIRTPVQMLQEILKVRLHWLRGEYGIQKKNKKKK